MATLSELLNKVATYGGKIVSTSELSEMEIATANACNNMFVDENALGYVWVGKDVSSVPKANEIIPLVSNRRELLINFCTWYMGDENSKLPDDMLEIIELYLKN